MGDKLYKSSLHETVSTTATDLWNDSSSVEELRYAIENGAVGATTNPVIVGNILKKEMHLWKDYIHELIKKFPDAGEVEITWKLNEAMAIKGAEVLLPIYNKSKGKEGRIFIQTNAQYYRNADIMIQQAIYFNTLAPNMQVKIPVTGPGLKAIEESTYHGISINATVSFTVSQSLAVGEAVERGLNRRQEEGKSISEMSPVCTMMVGRLDDWLKVVADRENIITDPGYLEWAGVAAFKKAYTLFKERKYRTRMLVAAFRNHMQWSEFIGGDIILTIPYKWQKRYNGSDVKVILRMDNPVDQEIIDELSKKFIDFRRAYDVEGLRPEEFEHYGASVRTLRQFIGGYIDLLGVIRNFMLPDPDKQ